jgi:class 3 adenylate cyclase
MPEAGYYVAEHIKDAQVVALPDFGGVYTWTDDNVHETAMEATKNFVSKLEHRNEANRVLATILFTDIVGSTELMSQLGDSKWRNVLQRHDATVRRELSRHRGRELDTAGDGFFAAFDGPARAVHAATAIRDALRPLGIEIRAGIHVGECEVKDDKIVGVAVSVGARIAAAAGPGEVLVSRTVKDLVAGSGLEFEDRGEHHLKGLAEPWQVFSAK